MAGCGVCRLNGNMSLQTNHKFKIRLVAGFHFAIGAARKMQIRYIFPIRRRWCIIKVWFSHPSNSLRPLRYPHEHTGTPNRFHSMTRNRLTLRTMAGGETIFPGKSWKEANLHNGLTTSEQSDGSLKGFISFSSFCCTWYPCHTPRILHHGDLA